MGYTYTPPPKLVIFRNFTLVFLFAKSGNLIRGLNRTHFQILILLDPETYTSTGSQVSTWGSPGQICWPHHGRSLPKEAWELYVCVRQGILIFH